MTYPSFDRAVSEFRQLLRSEGRPDTLLWVVESDVALVGGRLFVRPPDAEASASRARIRYEDAVRRQLGVKLSLLCRLGTIACCYIWGPMNAADAESALMPDGVKYQVREKDCIARRVDNSWAWAWLRFRERKWGDSTHELFK